MKTTKPVSILILVVSMVFTAFLYSESVSGIKVLKVFGDVNHQKSGQAVWNKSNSGDILNISDSIRTGLDSYAELEISPSNKMRVKEKSQVLVKDLDKESKDPDGKAVKLIDFALLEGDIVLQLDKLPKDTLLQVSSPTAVAGARGTAFGVKYSPENQTTDVGVLESKVLVNSSKEPKKFVLVPAYKKVSVAPWAMATPHIRGTGILSEKILGKQFIQAVAAPIMQATGRGDTEDKAKDNAYYLLAKRILSIPIGVDKTIEDILNEDSSMCQPLYSHIAKAEIVSTKKVDNRTEVAIQLAIAPVSDIIKKPLPPMPSIVKPITMKEYGDVFGAQARVTTQRAAQLDGYRKLAEIMFGTVISSETTLKDMAIKDDRVTTTVKGVVQGAETLDTQYFSDGSITLVMAVRADLVRSETAKITGDIFGSDYFTSPSVIDIDDFLKKL